MPAKTIREPAREIPIYGESGDGVLAAWSGAPFEVGDAHGQMLYPSMMFRLNGVDPAKAGEAWRTIPGAISARPVSMSS